MEKLGRRTSSTDVGNVIHVAFGLNDQVGAYHRNTIAVIDEICTHTDARVVFHIFHDETMDRAKQMVFERVVHQYQQDVCFHDITSEPEFEKMKIGMLYRLFIPRLCPDIKKMIYLDSDVLVLSNIKCLWDVSLEGYSLAAVLDLPYTRETFVRTKYYNHQGIDDRIYFNSGVLVMNLERMRKQCDLPQQYLQYISNHPHTLMLDQDFLNLKFQNNTLFLADKFNTICDDINMAEETELKKKCIVHLAGPFKPWNCRNPFVLNYFCQHYAVNYPAEEREEKMREYMTLLPERHFVRLGLKHSLLQQNKSTGGGQRFLLSLACLAKAFLNDAQYVRFARLVMFKLKLKFLYSFYYVYIKREA